MRPKATLESSCVSLLKLGNDDDDDKCLCGMMQATASSIKSSTGLKQNCTLVTLVMLEVSNFFFPLR